MLNFYRRAVKLRKGLHCVRHGEYKEHFHSSNRFYMYSMTSEKEKLLVVCSFADKEISYPMPQGFDRKKAQLILCNYKKPMSDTLRPFECKVYLFR